MYIVEIRIHFIFHNALNSEHVYAQYMEHRFRLNQQWAGATKKKKKKNRMIKWNELLLLNETNGTNWILFFNNFISVFFSFILQCQVSHSIWPYWKWHQQQLQWAGVIRKIWMALLLVIVCFTFIKIKRILQHCVVVPVLVNWLHTFWVI